MSTTSSRPFGSYFRETLQGELLNRVQAAYGSLLEARNFDAICESAIGLGSIFDGNLADLRTMVGGGDSRFSYFKGSFLEELTILIAEFVVAEVAPELGVEVVKLGTGQGIVAGVSLAVSRDHLPEKIRISLRRDREDVTIGFRRTLVLFDSTATEDDPAAVATFPNEIIPVVIVACKMYVDATRLENVIAKARNLSDQHARCTYLVVAEWDALGKDWHDERGMVVDSHYAPISRIVFLRGDVARRPAGNRRQAGHTSYPYLKQKPVEIRDAICVGIGAWMKKA
jgi:hypothetical protein